MVRYGRPSLSSVESYERTLSVPFSGERRVALTPAATANLVKKGIKVRIEEGAGALAHFNDEQYHRVGANVVSRKEAFQSDVVLKVSSGCQLP